jgi:hypothetical protein
MSRGESRVGAVTTEDATRRAAALADMLRESLAQDGQWIRVAGGSSMGDGLPSGSRVRVVPLLGPPSRGELLVFVLPERLELCCHRVERRGPAGRCLTRGDGKPAADGWIEPRHFVGRAAAFRTGGRWYDASSGIRPGVLRRGIHRLRRAIERRISAER